jgi:hypothetical protein
MAMTINSLQAYIGWGTSLSTVIDTGGNYVVGLIMPDNWTNASVSVLVSPDGAAYHDLFDFDLEDRTNAKELVFNITPGVMAAVNPNTLMMARYFKLRSGTRDEPVNQEATCNFTVITVDAIGAQPKLAEDVTE